MKGIALLRGKNPGSVRTVLSVLIVYISLFLMVILKESYSH